MTNYILVKVSISLWYADNIWWLSYDFISSQLMTIIHHGRRHPGFSIQIYMRGGGGMVPPYGGTREGGMSPEGGGMARDADATI